MTWEGVPWMIGGGAEHTAEVGRLLAYAATGGSEGVVGPGDCKVKQSSTPGANCVISAGGIAILNSFAGGGQQTYLGRNTEDITVDLTPQGASGVRYDLVCVVIEDPQYPGQPDPASVADGPYIVERVYEDVPSTTVSLAEIDPDQAGYALARIKWNASDSTVVTADITDLRQMVQPRRKEEVIVVNGAGTATMPYPAYAAVPANATGTVKVPSWATAVILEAHWSGLLFTDTSAGAGQCQYGAKVVLGTLSTVVTSGKADASASNKPITQAMIAADKVAIPDAMRGTNQTLAAQMAQTSTSGMTPQSTVNTVCLVKATFVEEPV